MKGVQQRHPDVEPLSLPKDEASDTKPDHGRAFLWEMPPAGDSLSLPQSDSQMPGSAGTGGPPAELHLADLGGTNSAAHTVMGPRQDTSWRSSIEELGARFDRPASVSSDAANEPLLPPTPPGGDVRDGLSCSQGATMFARDWQSGLNDAERFGLSHVQVSPKPLLRK
eukprot:4758684-Amphidinium_carterae.1